MKRFCPIFLCLLLAALPAFAAAFTSVKVVPASLAVGATTRHEIRFTTATAIPCSGSVVVTYPDGFTFERVSVVGQTDIDGTLAATVSGQVTFAVVTSGQTLTIRRNNDGVPMLAGGALSLVLANVTNGAAGSYTVEVAVLTSAGATLDGPQASSAFTIE